MPDEAPLVAIPQLAIGSEVWVYDENSRKYNPGDSHPVWRAHWRSTKISSDSSRNWITESGVHLPKKNPREATNPRKKGYSNYQPWVVFSLYELDLECWAHDHYIKLSDHIRRSAPRVAAAAIGCEYPVQPPNPADYI